MTGGERGERKYIGEKKDLTILSLFRGTWAFSFYNVKLFSILAPMENA